jgi:hypothetical protein
MTPAIAPENTQFMVILTGSVTESKMDGRTINIPAKIPYKVEME